MMCVTGRDPHEARIISTAYGPVGLTVRSGPEPGVLGYDVHASGEVCGRLVTCYGVGRSQRDAEREALRFWTKDARRVQDEALLAAQALRGELTDALAEMRSHEACCTDLLTRPAAEWSARDVGYHEGTVDAVRHAVAVLERCLRRAGGAPVTEGDR